VGSGVFSFFKKWSDFMPINVTVQERRVIEIEVDKNGTMVNHAGLP